jgi:WD40 repeat protein
MKDTPPVRQQSWRKCSRVAVALFLLFSAPSIFGQGSPDILWQGQHIGYVRYTTFSPDGQQLASGGDDRKNILWQASDGTLTRTITQCSGVGCRGSTFGFYSPDSQHLATAGIKFWRVADGTLARTLSAGGTIAFSPDWQFIASSITTSSYPSQTRSIALLRNDGSQVWKNTNAGGGATVFSPDGQLIASIGFAGIDLIRRRMELLSGRLSVPAGAILSSPATVNSSPPMAGPAVLSNGTTR